MNVLKYITPHKLIFGSFAVLVVLSIAASYYLYAVQHNFLIRMTTSCDTSLETCYVPICSEADGCDVNSGVEPFKVIEIAAGSLPVCDARVENCPEPACTKDNQCTTLLCSENPELAEQLNAVCSQ